jgi:methionyl-tRNA formyltransferase
MSKVLFLARNKLRYNNLILNILKKKFTKVEIFKSDHIGQDLPNKFYEKKYDYVFSYRNYIILKQRFLNQVNVAAINFHPAPPNLRGFAPASFAILKNLKKFGSTVHIMDHKLDHGLILDVKYFKIPKRSNIQKLLNLTYYNQILQIKFFFRNFEIFLKKKNSKYKWSKNIYSKKEIDNKMYIKSKFSKRKINLIIRATKIGKFKPYTIKNGKKKYF